MAKSKKSDSDKFFVLKISNNKSHSDPNNFSTNEKLRFQITQICIKSDFKNYFSHCNYPKYATELNLVKMHHCASLDSSPTWLMTSTESRPVVLSVIDHRNNLEDNDTGYLMAKSTF